MQDGKHISYGEDFQEVVRRCYDMNPEQLIAVGANCLAPRFVESLFKGLNKGREHNPVPLIVYPNSGENYNAQLGYEVFILSQLLGALSSNRIIVM